MYFHKDMFDRVCFSLSTVVLTISLMNVSLKVNEDSCHIECEAMLHIFLFAFSMKHIP